MSMTVLGIDNHADATAEMQDFDLQNILDSHSNLRLLARAGRASNGLIGMPRSASFDAGIKASPRSFTLVVVVAVRLFRTLPIFGVVFPVLVRRRLLRLVMTRIWTTAATTRRLGIGGRSTCEAVRIEGIGCGCITNGGCEGGWAKRAGGEIAARGIRVSSPSPPL